MKNKAIVNYFIDVGLALTFFTTSITGILKFPKIIFLLEINEHIKFFKTITFIHDWSGIVMTLLVVIHIILHWKWIVIMTKKIFGQKGKNKR